jgi:CRP-like cAMP-binding protein
MPQDTRKTVPPHANPALETAMAGHPFLKDLPPQVFKKLADSGMLIRFSPGQQIFVEGDPANRFYLIVSGTVVLSAPGANKSNVTLQKIGPGEVLGWSWLFPPFSWHFDAAAETDVDAIFFYGTRLREECETDHDLGYELLKRMSSIVVHRLQVARRKLVTLSALKEP